MHANNIEVFCCCWRGNTKSQRSSPIKNISTSKLDKTN